MSIERTVKPPESGYANGWDFNRHRLRTGGGGLSYAVFRAWTTSFSNGEGHAVEGERKSGSRGASPLYATESDALLALREAVEAEAAEQLRRIDARITALEEK